MKSLFGVLILTIFIMSLTSCSLDTPPAPIADNPWDPENPLAPRSPEFFTGAAASEVSAQFSWEDLSGNEDGFRIMVNGADNIPFSKEHIVGADTTVIIIGGLWKNTAYQCKLFAFNETGLSPFARVIDLSTADVKPTPPADLSVRSISATEVSLTWQDMSENETGFYIMGTQDDSTNFQLVSDLSPNETDVTYNVPDKFTTYYYRVSAHNTFGISPYLGSVWITPGSSPPETPKNFEAEAISESEVYLSWVDESDNAENIVIFIGINDSLSLDPLVTLSSDIENYTAAELAPNSDFYFKIRSQNRFSQSELSQIVSTSTSNVPPTSPGNLHAESVSETAIFLRWTDQSYIESSYQMEQSYLNIDDFRVIGETAANTEEMSVENLIREATYFYRVRARGVYGSSPWSEVLQVVTSSLPPVAPDSLEGEIISPTEISLDWKDNSNIETGFNLYRSRNSTSNWQRIANLPPNIVSFNDTDLNQDTRYYYKILARNEFGQSEFSNEIELRTPSIPASPSGLIATGITPSEIEIVWSDRSDNEVGFFLEEKIEDGEWIVLYNIEANEERFVVGSRNQLTTYQYRMQTFNQWGTSAYSNIDSATPYTLIAFVASSEAGMIVVNITDPSAPEIITQFDTPGNAMHIEVSDSNAYIADSYAGVRVIEVNDPRSPEELTDYDAGGQARSLLIKNEYAYVAHDDNGFVILDITVPENPQFVGRYHSEGLEVFDVAVEGRIAYLAAGAIGIVKVDISNHRTPELVEVLDTYGAAYGIQISGGFGYAADFSGGLTVIELSNFSEAGFSRAPNNALQLELREEYAFIANNRSGLSIVDISTPNSPQEIASLDTPGEARGVTLFDDLAFVSDYAGGLRIIDISDPSDPDEIGSVQLPGRAQDSAVRVYR